MSTVATTSELPQLVLWDVIEADRTCLGSRCCKQCKTTRAIISNDGREVAELVHVLLGDFDDQVRRLARVSSLLLDLRDCCDDAIRSHGVDDVEEIFLVRQPAPRVVREVPIDALLVLQRRPDALR